MSSNSKVIVIGATGTIGSALLMFLREKGVLALKTSRTDDCAAYATFDLSNVDQLKIPENTSVAYLLAGVTSMQACSSDPVGTRAINVVNSLRVAEDLVASGSHVLIVSTNLVLSGNNPNAQLNELPNPQNVYAAQKLELENYLLSSTNTTVLRISKLSETILPLMHNWRNDLARNRPIHPLSNLRCAPVSLSLIVQALFLLGTRRRAGLFQLSGPRDWTYSEIAFDLARQGGFELDLVRPQTSEQMGIQLSACPLHTTLNVEAIEKELEGDLERPKDDISRMIKLTLNNE